MPKGIKGSGVPRPPRLAERYNAFITGELSVEDLDQEELLKGQLRASDGTFRGEPPRVIPREFHNAVTRELLQRAQGTIREHFDEAIQVFIKIMNDTRVYPQWRLQAAQYVWERMAGKIPEISQVSVSVAKWEEVADEILLDMPDFEGAVIDGEIMPETGPVEEMPALPPHSAVTPPAEPDEPAVRDLGTKKKVTKLPGARRIL